MALTAMPWRLLYMSPLRQVRMGMQDANTDVDEAFSLVAA